MAEALNRLVRVVVGRQGAPGREFSGLKISKVTKDDAPGIPNTAEVKVWNLGQLSREATREPDAIIQVFAGYGENAPLIFLGAITRSESTDDGVDIVTTIQSGKATPGKAQLSQSFRGQQQLKDMLGIATEALGAVGVDLSSIPDGTPAKGPRGVVLSGDPNKVLNKLTRANRLDWFVEDGVVKVVPRGNAIQERAFVLSPTSGLIGSPRILKPGKPEGGGARLGVEFSAKLNAEFRLRRIVQIDETKELAGWYVIRRLVHEGDNWTGPFKTTCECTPARTTG